MRLFVAAEVPEEVRRRLEGIGGSLADLPLRVRWVQKEAMHLTFAFLGEVPLERIEAVERALGRPETAPDGPFNLVVRGLGTFPGTGTPRVIWAGIEGDLDAAARLKISIDAALAPLGFKEEKRDFRPHLTLGRVAGRRGRGDWRPFLEPFAATEFGSFEVGACVLFESRLLPQGAQYHARQRYPAGGARAAR